MRYLLDTNIFIAAMRGVDVVRERLERTALADLVLSPVVLGELELGVEKSAHREKNAARLARLVEQLELAPLDARVSRRYWLAQQGRGIEGMTEEEKWALTLRAKESEAKARSPR